MWGRVGCFPVGFWRSGGVEKEEDGRSNGGSGYWSENKEFTGGSGLVFLLIFAGEGVLVVTGGDLAVLG